MYAHIIFTSGKLHLFVLNFTSMFKYVNYSGSTVNFNQKIVASKLYHTIIIIPYKRLRDVVKDSGITIRTIIAPIDPW